MFHVVGQPAREGPPNIDYSDKKATLLLRPGLDTCERSPAPSGRVGGCVLPSAPAVERDLAREVREYGTATG
jgi:hypothetical protein